jgi:hypothetical protein
VRKKKLSALLVSGAMVAAVTSGLVVVNGAASADVQPGSLGFLTVAPATGTISTSPTPIARTSAPCPDVPGDASADLLLIGPVGSDGVTAPDTATFPSTNPFPMVVNNSTQFSKHAQFNQVLGNTFQDAATLRGKTIQPGEYHLTTDCTDNIGLQNFGTFTAGLTFDDAGNYTVITPPNPSPSTSPSPSPSPSTSPSPSPSPSTSPSSSPSPSPNPSPTATPTPTPGAGATATTTTLTMIRIRLPLRLGGFVIPIVRVIPHVAGTIQIKNGTANLGGPVPVAAGFAFGGFFVLPRGTHSLTAVFTPTDPAAVQPSTSNTVTVAL